VPDKLIPAVNNILTNFAADVDEGHIRDQVLAIAANLSKPLRIAVAGGVSAGKSTLVNALLEQNVAVTGAGETTQVLARFESGPFEDVELILKDGSRRQLALQVNGQLPLSLGVDDLDLVEDLRVQLPTAELLRHLAIIDTPGLASVHDNIAERTADRLFETSAKAVADADAIIYLFKRAGGSDDADAISTFTELTSGAESCMVNAVGVTNRFEKDDPLGKGERVARQLMSESLIHMQLSAVIPIVALLAETANSATLANAHFSALMRLNSLDAASATVSESEFRHQAQSAGEQEIMIEELLRHLGLYGLRVALSAIRAGAGSLTKLYPVLREASGFDRLATMVRERFVPRSDLLKADQALGALKRLSHQTTPMLGSQIRGQIEKVLLEPISQPLRELRALRKCAEDPDGLLPPRLQAELVRVASPGTVREKLGLDPDDSTDVVRQVALERASAAHEFANAPTTTARARSVAEVIRMSYSDLSEQVDEPPDSEVGERVGPTHDIAMQAES
jgi:GTPase Era involved in 16S rRNA processing